MKHRSKKLASRGGADVAAVSPRELKPELGYIWQPPPAPTAASFVAWTGLVEDPVEGMAAELVELEWRVADLRQEIEALGLQAKGRTRKALAEQLASAFLDKVRLAQAVAELSESDRNAYILLLMQANLQGYYAAPETNKLWQRLTKMTSRLRETLRKAGLVLLAEDGQLFVPFGLIQCLPQLAFPFSTLKQPARIAPAADPHTMLGQIQQLLALVQTETFKLQPRLRWKAPSYPYAQPIISWPPSPDDAEKLLANIQSERMLELLPPDPYLDPGSLQRLSTALGISPEWAEFYYHLLLASGMILSGSPLVVNQELGHAWMALAPGEQICAAYRVYRTIVPWAVWWPRWRSGEVRVRRSYHGYWGLNSTDEAVTLASTNLRWVLLEILALLPHDVWLDLEALDDLLIELFPTVASHRYLMGLTLECGEEGWLDFMHTVLVDILAGPLYMFGFVDLSPSLDEVGAFRIHGLQDVQWGRVMEVPLEATWGLRAEAIRLVVDPAHRSAARKADAAPDDGAVLEVQTPVPPAFTTFVLRWARPAGFSRNLVRYELDVPRLHESFESGEDIETLSESWTSAAGFPPLPEMVNWWRVWWNRYGRVRLYPAQALLQTRDAFTLQEVRAALPNLQSSILGIVTPQVALLEPADVDKILDALSRQGYMPKESS